LKLKKNSFDEPQMTQPIIPNPVGGSLDLIALHKFFYDMALSSFGLSGSSTEKKAQVSVPELRANETNQETFRDAFILQLQEYFNRVNTLFGVNIRVRANYDN